MPDKRKQPLTWRAWAVIWQKGNPGLFWTYTETAFVRAYCDAKPIRVTITEGWPKGKRRTR